MIAWVSPSRMVRSTPLRISLGPSSVCTETCRSLISSVAMSVLSDVGVGVDQYVVAVDPRGVHGDRDGGREAGGLAGAQVEAGAVQPALDGAVLHVALRERDRRVAALVLDGEDLVAVEHDGHVEAVDLDPQGRAVGQLAQGTGSLEAHEVILWTFFSS